ncbi:MAG: GlsB/YeaQ/YmgE family stress response membrane protein [Candidatus Dormibacteraeota bacterium]|nr:GlsB/YeaQ/YmgE family stress response membrane protein [Candidatus Dormibacteraeota bacterium]
MGILVWIIVGAIAGFLASKVLSGRGMGLPADIVVGILGAFLGGWLAGLVGMPVSSGTFTIGGIVAAFVGAVILLVVFRAVSGGRLLHR